MVVVVARTDVPKARSKVKYIGITLGTRLSLLPHIHYFIEKARLVLKILDWFTANTSGRGLSKSRHLLLTYHSIYLWGV